MPCLLIRDGALVKTVRFEGPRYLGDPINAVRIFNEKEVDELVLLDISATSSRRAIDFSLVERIVSEAFMPVAYGGAIRTVEDGRRLLSLGVEKLALNTAAMERPELVGELSSMFGAQCVIGVVDVKRRLFGGHVVYSHAGVRPPLRDPVGYAKRLVELGAGEILVQSVDQDGTMAGFDLTLLRSFDGALRVPLVAAGGAGSVKDMQIALDSCALSGLAVGARFVFQGPHRAVLINYLSEQELDLLSSPSARRA